METIEFRAVYTTLDTLLDTRLATMMIAYPDLFKQTVTSRNYFKRDLHVYLEGDEMISLTFLDYLYNNRKPKILTIAPPTEAIHLCTKILVDYNMSADTKNVNNKYKILVNTYPYKLSNMDEVILMGKFNGIISNFADVELFYKHPDKVDFEFLLENNIHEMVVYDGFQWLTRALIISDMLKDGNILNMRFFTNPPKMLLSKNNQILSNGYKLPTPREEIEKMLRIVIPTYVVDETVFSCIDIDKIKKEQV